MCDIATLIRTLFSDPPVVQLVELHRDTFWNNSAVQIEDGCAQNVTRSVQQCAALCLQDVTCNLFLFAYNDQWPPCTYFDTGYLSNQRVGRCWTATSSGPLSSWTTPYNSFPWATEWATSQNLTIEQSGLVRAYGLMVETIRKYLLLDGWKVGWVGGWVDELIGGWMDGWMVILFLTGVENYR